MENKTWNVIWSNNESKVYQYDIKGGDEYLYKYVINDKHWVVNDEEP